MRFLGRSEDKREISLALQGGGSHGAFTWGVLDRLLDSDRADIVAISGASAGAVTLKGPLTRLRTAATSDGQ